MILGYFEKNSVFFVVFKANSSFLSLPLEIFLHSPGKKICGGLWFEFNLGSHGLVSTAGWSRFEALGKCLPCPWVKTTLIIWIFLRRTLIETWRTSDERRWRPISSKRRSRRGRRWRSTCPSRRCLQEILNFSESLYYCYHFLPNVVLFSGGEFTFLIDSNITF